MSGRHIGYIRACVGQTAPQLDGVPLNRVFDETLNAKSLHDRPVLRACIDYLLSGDVLHVDSMDRLAGNLADLSMTVETLTAKGVTIRFHKEELVFGAEQTPMGKLHIRMLEALAGFERALVRERQRAGIEEARKKGVYSGRKPTLTPTRARELCQRAAAGEPKAQLAREFGISREAVYKYLARGMADNS
ncbi:recombinase family protein [Propionivibrio limicola]|uniref:recombinase family protein n=1 Tax=Propionivibrio limicola TaxID=167645 RepID=UPI001291D19F|nr:recombinase family protein [Propionivibrio limicola]